MSSYRIPCQCHQDVVFVPEVLMLQSPPAMYVSIQQISLPHCLHWMVLVNMRVSLIGRPTVLKVWQIANQPQIRMVDD